MLINLPTLMLFSTGIKRGKALFKTFSPLSKGRGTRGEGLVNNLETLERSIIALGARR